MNPRIGWLVVFALLALHGQPARAGLVWIPDGFGSDPDAGDCDACLARPMSVARALPRWAENELPAAMPAASARYWEQVILGVTGSARGTMRGLAPQLLPGAPPP